MADETNILALRIAGTDYRGWTSVNVTRSIESAASSFSLSVTDVWPDQDDPIRIFCGDECEIVIGDDVVLTGYVEAVTSSHSGRDHSITVTGHSRTIDLVQCSCISDSGSPLQFKAGKTILEIARALARPYGFSADDIICTETNLDTLPRFVPEVGETVYSAIERLAREQSLLITDDALGRLVMTRLGSGKGVDLIHPGNILSAGSTVDTSDRFSEYRVKGQRVADDGSFGKDTTSEATIEDDDDIARTRVLVLKGEKQMNQDACRKRATWEAVTRAGRSVDVIVTVRGWRDQNGDLYDVNTNHFVQDGVIGIDGYLLASEVAFAHDGQGGALTGIRLAPPGAFEPQAPKKRKTKITKGVRAIIRGEV